MSLAAWFGFLLAAILIAITPGPGAALSMDTGLRQGYRSALAAILGLQAAILAHLAIVAIGFGALLAASESAFFVVKFVGATYLIWLGVQKWRDSPVALAEYSQQSGMRKNLFLQGLLVNLTNPKAIIFIGALVPQFVDPLKQQLPQYLLIATTLCLTDILVMSSYALAAVRMGSWLRDDKAVRLLNHIFGGLFVSAGAFLAMASRPS